ncbi:two-component regulator propeller domain-containing protein [Aquimonas sp.]|uniref:ligand-binding sensor domain-containing diguanylate cyclase n=1 Tax=Aquimonas sp. TaxID=1872588 RepID=UPI0037C058CE
MRTSNAAARGAPGVHGRKLTVVWALRLLALMTAFAATLPAVAEVEVEAKLERSTALFERVGDHQRIPDGVVTALAQDAEGFVWIGTTEALIRFDGYRFKSYRHDPADPGSLPGSRIESLLAASDGRLWVGTYSSGIAVYDASTDQFAAIESRIDPTDAPRVPAAASIRALTETPDGAIWIGTTGRGLLRVDPDGSTRVYSAQDSAYGLIDDRISALAVDAHGCLWVGSWNGLVRLRPGAERFERVLSDPDDPESFYDTAVRGIYAASDGALWVSSQQGQMARVPAAFLDAPGLPQPQQVQRWRGVGMNSAVEPGDGSLWIAHYRGIDIYGLDGQLRQTVRHRVTEPLSLADAGVRTLLRDRSGWLWVGTFGGGLQRTHPLAGALSARRYDAERDAPLRQLSVSSMAPTPDGGLWIGADRNGAARLDAQLRIREFIAAEADTNGGLNGTMIQGLALAADQTLWVATERGLNRRQPGETDFELVTDPSFIEGKVVRRLWPGSAGELWIASGDGLFLRDVSGQVRRFATAAGATVGGSVNALSFDADGGWVGGSSGLFRLDAQRQALTPVAIEVDGRRVQADVLGLLVDQRGQLWVDGGGLLRLRELADGVARFEAISARFGYAGIAFGANLMEDAQGRIWSHRFMFDPAADVLHRLGRAEGALAGTGWFRAHARLADGRMVFGATEGLLVVQPERFEPWTFEPPIVVTALRINGEERRLGPRASEVVLQPDESSFAVEFAALDYSAPDLLQYRYRLQGRSADWVAVDATARSAAFGGLWPGDYLLQVQASNRSGRFSSQTLELPIVVVPRWWQTSAALALALVIIGVLVELIVRLRRRRLEAAKLQLEAEVQARTLELSRLSAELERRTAESEQARLIDPLTGLRNHRFAMREMPKEVAQALRRLQGREESARRPGAGLVLFRLQLDGYVPFVIAHGANAGEPLLRQFADRMREVFRPSDSLIRWGGEEFLVLAREIDREAAADLAAQLCARVSAETFSVTPGGSVEMTASVGFAPFPLLATEPFMATWEDVVELADRVLRLVQRVQPDAWAGLYPERSNATALRSVDWLDPALIERGGVRLLSSIATEVLCSALSESTTSR